MHDEANIRTILQSVTDGLLVFDQNATLILMNPAAEALLAFYPAAQGGSSQAARQLYGWLQGRGMLLAQKAHIELALPSEPLVRAELDSIVATCLMAGCAAARQRELPWPCWLDRAEATESEMRQCAIYQRVSRRAIQVQTAEVRDTDGACWERWWCCTM